METKFKNLQNKIYLMSNSFLTLDMFFNDIRDNSAENYDKEMAYKDLEIIADFILDLQQQLAEKDKEIEELNKTLEMCKHIERYDIGEMFLKNAKLIIEKRQFAIQELEKVKVNLKDRISMMKNEEHSYLQKVVAWYDICDQINQQIKELKGE